MRVCMQTCRYGFVCVRRSVCTCACTQGCIYDICMYVCMYVRLFVCLYVCNILVYTISAYMYVSMHVRMYACEWACVCTFACREHQLAQPHGKVRSCEELGGQETRRGNGSRSTEKCRSDLQHFVAEACSHCKVLWRALWFDAFKFDRPFCRSSLIVLHTLDVLPGHAWCLYHQHVLFWKLF